MDLLRQSSATRENLSLLSVLEALENGEKITQREIAHTTGLNLKKVNYCLHKLLNKGYVKFQRVRKSPDKRAYLYILTPIGLKAKSQLTYGFLKFTLDFYNRMEKKLRNCLKEMTDSGVKSIVLYGTSDIVRILLELSDSEGPKIIGVVDPCSNEQEFQGMLLIRQDELLLNRKWDGVLITTLEDVADVEADLVELGVACEMIWKLS
jgi:EPS-associated MarR family transcriptional regulator